MRVGTTDSANRSRDSEPDGRTLSPTDGQVEAASSSASGPTLDGVTSASSLILVCVESGLESIGGSAKVATLYFIESRYGLKMCDIPNNPQRLVDALRGIFGLGSAELFRAMLREFHVAIGRLKMDGVTRREDALMDDFAKALEEGLRSVETGIV